MLRLRVPSLVALALLAPAAMAQQFMYSAGALPAQTLFTDGVELVDVDNDQDVDIIFANRGGTGIGAYGAGTAAVQHLFLNNGSAVFSAAHANLNVANFASSMVIAEDVDNDGDPDLVYARDSGWPSPTAGPKVLINNGSGIFADESASRIPVGFTMTGFCIAGGDVDNDGDTDLVAINGGTFSGVATQARLLLNDGSGVYTEATATNLPVDTYNAQDVTLFDVDNDLDIDIALSGKGSTTKRSRLYLNDGTGVFSISTALDAVGSGGTYEIDYGDLDGDGDFDAAVQSMSGFTEGWARNDGPTTVWPEFNFVNPINADDNEMGCLDYDNDGDLDVFVGQLGTGSERVYNNVAGVLTHAPGVVQSQSDSTMDLGFADLNGDGKYDLVTGQGESGNFTNRVYLNNGSADTLAPVFVVVETPASVGASTTVFRARVADAISEDGHVSATMDYSYTTIGAGSGSGTAFHQGGGQFRAEVPTAGASEVSLTWTATDAAGNAAVNGPITVGGPASPWTDIGCALAGVSGLPALAGTGTLVAGSPGSVDLTNAAPSAAALLFLSVTSSPVPFKGGSLCAFPFILTLPVATDGTGALSLGWPSWPSGTSGISVFFQYAIDDAAAIKGVALSNTLQGDVP